MRNTKDEKETTITYLDVIIYAAENLIIDCEQAKKTINEMDDKTKDYTTLESNMESILDSLTALEGCNKLIWCSPWI